jgi:hypothetical protein
LIINNMNGTCDHRLPFVLLRLENKKDYKMKTLSKTLAIAALMTGAISFSAQAEIAMNTDTGVNVQTVMESGLKPEMRLVTPAQQNVVVPPVATAQADLNTTTVLAPRAPALSQAGSMQAARDQLAVEQAQDIADSTDSSLVTVNGETYVPTDDTSVIQPRGNTLVNMGTRMQAPLDTTETSPVYQPSAAAIARAPLDRDTTGSASLGAQTSVAAQGDINSSLATQGAIGTSEPVIGMDSNVDTMNRSRLNSSVNSARTGSMSGTSVGSASLDSGM